MLNIGSLEIENDLVLAPMAGYTNLGFRLTIKKLGAGLVTTEMVSAMGLTLNHGKTLDYLKSLFKKLGLDVRDDTYINEKSEKRRNDGLYCTGGQ